LKTILKLWLAALALGASLVFAQAEPSMAEIYAAAQSGQMAKAHAMVQQVLVSHPNSAKAHYVQAELYAKEGNMTLARENLAQAERIAPGLPFARPDAVQALKSELSAPRAGGTGLAATAIQTPEPQAPWGWLLFGTGAVMLIG
jgi:tetratricopeptide (TPR) repeat protein